MHHFIACVYSVLWFGDRQPFCCFFSAFFRVILLARFFLSVAFCTKMLQFFFAKHFLDNERKLVLFSSFHFCCCCCHYLLFAKWRVAPFFMPYHFFPTWTFFLWCSRDFVRCASTSKQNRSCLRFLNVKNLLSVAPDHFFSSLHWMPTMHCPKRTII